MDAAHTIREAVARVEDLRAQAKSDPALLAATVAVKSIQAKRFETSYSDLLVSTEYGGAARFFLEELYGVSDYSLRDAQFARVAGALQALFPAQVIDTAVSLAQLHVLTEELDHKMAIAWMGVEASKDLDNRAVSRRYIQAWRVVGRLDDRNRQLDVVLAVGSELDRLTRAPGLRLMLRMMRRPAVAAGLGSLQTFLESGFDTFASMSGKGRRATEFLALVQARESRWLDGLYTSDALACERLLHASLNGHAHQS